MLRLNGSTRRTRVKTKQNDPIYEEEFSYLCKPPEEVRGRSTFMKGQSTKWPSLQVMVEDDDKETINEKLGEVSISLAPVALSRSKSREVQSRGGSASSSNKIKNEDDENWTSKLKSGQLVRKWFKLDNGNKVNMLTSFGNSIGGLLGNKTQGKGKGTWKGNAGKGGKGKGKGGKGGGKGKGGKGKVMVLEPEVLLELEWIYNEDLIDMTGENTEDKKDPLNLTNEEKAQEVYTLVCILFI